MTIKKNGGIFGRNPAYYNVEVENDLRVGGDLIINDVTASGSSSLDGAVVINESGADVDFRVESDINPTALFVQGSNGNVGIGTGSPSQSIDTTGNILLRTNGSYVAIRNSSGVNAAVIQLSSGDITNVGGLFAGAQTVLRSAVGEAARLDTSGHLIVPNGVTLGTVAGTYNAANTLDDYEEGTWTPAFSGGDYSFTYNKQKGSYTKIGNRVFIDCVLYVHPTIGPSGSVDGDLEITNLPYTFNKQNDVEVVGGIAHFKQLFMSTVEVLAARLDDGGTSFKLYDTLATNYPELAYVQASDVAANTRIRIQFSYPTNG